MEQAGGDSALVIVAESFVLRLLICSPKKVELTVISMQLK